MIQPPAAIILALALGGQCAVQCEHDRRQAIFYAKLDRCEQLRDKALYDQAVACFDALSKEISK